MLPPRVYHVEFEHVHEVIILKELTIEEKIIEELGIEFVAIAECESGLRQYNSHGDVIVSRTSDVGVLQINQVHWDNAERLGYDIYTVDGNIAYAKYLKERNGTRDWYMSEHCWSPKVAYNN